MRGRGRGVVKLVRLKRKGWIEVCTSKVCVSLFCVVLAKSQPEFSQHGPYVRIQDYALNRSEERVTRKLQLSSISCVDAFNSFYE